MSSEQIVSVDDKIESWVGWLVSFLPVAWIPRGLHLFAQGSDLLSSVSNQLMRTGAAITQSFREDKVIFLSSANDLAVRVSGLLEPVLASSQYTWSYDTKTRVFNAFKDGSVPRLKGSGWLSGELWLGDMLYADISPWLETVKITTAASVPSPNMIVQAWAIDHGRTLGALEMYTLKVITEEADVQEFPLRSV